jgi:N-acetylglutamate synthase-like GNAT family acetyltransferase
VGVTYSRIDVRVPYKMQWSLRDAEETDVEGMLSVHVSSTQKMLPCSYNREEMKSILSPQHLPDYAAIIENGYCVVAECNRTGDIIAFGCIARTSNSDFSSKCDFELLKLYVHPSASRRGIGTEIYQKLEKRIVNQGASGIGVVSTLYAEPFYISCGFSVTVEDAVKHFGWRSVKCKHMEKWLN